MRDAEVQEDALRGSNEDGIAAVSEDMEQLVERARRSGRGRDVTGLDWGNGREVPVVSMMPVMKNRIKYAQLH